MILLMAPWEVEKQKQSITFYLSLKKIIFMVDETPRQGSLTNFPIIGTLIVIGLQQLTYQVQVLHNTILSI